MDTTKAITHISLCSGYEGIGLGLRRVLPNLREIAYVEREGFPIANLVSKIEAGELDAAPVFTDVKQFPYGKFRGQVDILSGGFPCQPFSCAGQRKATDDPRHLFPYIRDGIRDCKPRIVFLENVAGIISAKTGDGESVLQYVLRELEGLGYRATAGIFSASEVGAPHQRKRVFILGMANGDGVRHDGRELSDRDGGRSIPKQAQPRSEQSLVWGEAEGCSRDSREELENASVAGTRNINRETEGAVGRVKGLRQGDRETGSVWTDPTSSEELGNTSDLRLQQPSADSRETGSDPSGEERRVYEPQGASSLSRYGSQSQGSQELADRIDEGSQGRIHGGQDTQRKGVNGHTGRSCSSSHRGWPSRPGERQHDWEAPRVTAVGDTTSQQGSSEDNGGEPRASSQSREVQSGGGHSGSLRDSAGQAQSRLGRTPNGSTSRVDRLRLLGNGVVPATATKAFVTLIQRLNNA